MTTEQPYTPSEARVCIDYCNAVVARRKADPSTGMAEADAEFDRFIEAVKRDAAREALTTLAAEHQARSVGNGLISDMHLMAQQRAEAWRDHTYPEETP